MGGERGYIYIYIHIHGEKVRQGGKRGAQRLQKEKQKGGEKRRGIEREREEEEEEEEKRTDFTPKHSTKE